jgi:hypothetical protein
MRPLEKRRPRGPSAAPQKPPEWASNKSDQAKAQACEHGATFVDQPRGHPNREALWCAHCGVFLRWMPKKARSVERHRLNASRIAKLAMHPDLNDWGKARLPGEGFEKPKAVATANVGYRRTRFEIPGVLTNKGARNGNERRAVYSAKDSR